MPVKQTLIDKLIADESEDKCSDEHSLREAALKRAMSNNRPTTLTPWEWEEWYATHNIEKDLGNPVKTEAQNAVKAHQKNEHEINHSEKEAATLQQTKTSSPITRLKNLWNRLLG